jgi:hypothetical protein
VGHGQGAMEIVPKNQNIHDFNRISLTKHIPLSSLESRY